MKTINCLVVDDEPLARKLLISHVAKIEGLRLAGECGDAFAAISALQRKEVDLLFLDIQMPEFSGLQLIKTLKNPPPVILTTAYREYAVEAFDLEVIDYLVKPISFERFLRAVNRYFDQSSPAVSSQLKTDDEFVMIRSQRKTLKVPLEKILYVESLDSYVKVCLPDREIISHDNISSFAGLLPADRFVRIHRSFIVSIRHVESIDGEGVFITGRLLPFGRAFRLSARERLGVD